LGVLWSSRLGVGRLWCGFSSVYPGAESHRDFLFRPIHTFERVGSW
jgi:hypothetical protein